MDGAAVIDDLVRKVVLQRELRTPAARRVAGYAAAGKRFAERYEQVAGASSYSKEYLDETVLSFRAAMEAGWISEGQFKRIRRLAADIEDMADYGAIADDILPAWGRRRNPLNRPVAAAVKTDREDVIGLSLMVLDTMAHSGYSEQTVGVYRSFALPKLIWFFIDRGSTKYSDEAIEEFLEYAVRELEEGISQRWFAYVIAAPKHVKKMHDESRLHNRKGPGVRTRVMVGPDAMVVAEFERWCAEECHLSDSTIVHGRHFVGLFLESLRDLGCDDLEGLTRQHVVDARRAITAGHEAKYAGSMLASVRRFADFAAEKHPEIPAFREWVGPGPKMRKKQPLPGYSAEQAEAIVASVDLTKSTGLRDRAMLTLAKNTALRSIDIIGLKLGDIKWREGVVSVVQSKNGRQLLLPLDTETGEAIAEYILESRRKGSGYDNVFLTAVGPATPLTRAALYNVVVGYATPVVGPNFKGRHGIHAFRRGLGGELVEAGVPSPEIAEILGHADERSSDPYMAVAVERKRICAVGLDGVQPSLEWLP